MAGVNGIDHLVPHDDKKAGYDNYGFQHPDTQAERDRLESVVTEDSRFTSPANSEDPVITSSDSNRKEDVSNEVSGNGVIHNHEPHSAVNEDPIIPDEMSSVNTESHQNNVDSGYEHFAAIANEAKILNNETQITIPDDAVINFNTGRVRVKKNNIKSSHDEGEEKIPLEKMESNVSLSCTASEKALEAQNNDSHVQNGVRTSTDSTNSTVPVANPLTSEKLIQQSNGTRKTFEEYFIPVNTHKKFIRGEKLYLMKDNRKLCQGWRRVIICGFITIIIAIAILVGVLAAARILIAESENKTSKPESGLLLPDRASMSQEGSSLKYQPSSQVPHKFLPLTTANLPPKTTVVIADAAEEGVSQTTSEVNTKVPSFTSNSPYSHTVVPNALVGEFTITDENFTDDLKDNSSAEYQRFSEHLESELKRIFRENGGEFETLRILNYRPGSVIVSFVVIWKEEERIILAKQAAGIFEAYLKNHSNLFLVFQVNETSVKFTDVIDECRNQNGGCSYKCVWSYLTLTKNCVCPHHMELLQDGKSCGIILSTTSSTVSETYFQPLSPGTEATPPETSETVSIIDSEAATTAEVTTPNQEASTSYSTENTSPHEIVPSEESTSPTSHSSTSTGNPQTEVIVKDETTSNAVHKATTEPSTEFTTSESTSTNYRVIVWNESNTPITTYTDTFPSTLSNITTIIAFSKNETSVTTEISTVGKEAIMDTSHTTIHEKATEPISHVIDSSSEQSLASELTSQTLKTELTTLPSSTLQTTNTFEPMEEITTPEQKETEPEKETETHTSSSVDQGKETSTLLSTKSEGTTTDHQVVTKIFTLARETVETLAQETALHALSTTTKYVNLAEATETIPTMNVNTDRDIETPEVQSYDNTQPFDETTQTFPVSEMISPFLPSETSSVKTTATTTLESVNSYTSDSTYHTETTTHAEKTTGLITTDNHFMLPTERTTEPVSNTESITKVRTDTTLPQMTLPVSVEKLTTENFPSSVVTHMGVDTTTSIGPEISNTNTRENGMYSDTTEKDKIVSTEANNWHPITDDKQSTEDATTVTGSEGMFTPKMFTEDATGTNSNEDGDSSDFRTTDSDKTDSTTAFSHLWSDSLTSVSPSDSHMGTTVIYNDMTDTTTTSGTDNSTIQIFNFTMPSDDVSTGSNESESGQTEPDELYLDNITLTTDNTTLDNITLTTDNTTLDNITLIIDNTTLDNITLTIDNITLDNITLTIDNSTLDNITIDNNTTLDSTTLQDFISYENGTEYNATYPYEDMNTSVAEDFNTTAYNMSSYEENANFSTNENIDVMNQTSSELVTNSVDCKKDQFHCEPLNTCINNTFVCDGIIDCPDKSDENDCEENCHQNFRCPNTTQCIINSARCDGIWDCEDGSDEENCIPTECAKHEVMCSDGSRCIKPAEICNWNYDCKDRSDEVGCIERTTCETGDRFFCNDGLCIPRALKCDGIKDCKENEDEANCTCMPDEFQCYDGTCLRSSSRCDGIANCKDDSDEMGCVNVDENKVVITYEPYSGSWSLLCADDWTLDDGRYLCQELGFEYAESIEKHHVSFNGSWMAMKRDNSSLKSLWTQRVTFTESCSSNLAAAVTCQNFTCGNFSGLLHRRRRDVENSFSPASNWPFIAYVSIYHSPDSCFSVILTPLWLITSAECLINRLGEHSQNGTGWYVRTVTSREVESDLAQKHEVLKIVFHPHSSKFRSLILRDYNVALIRLKHPLIFSDKIGAICLGKEQIPSGIVCFTGVIGATNPRAPPPPSPVLSNIPLMVVEREACNTVMHYNNQVDERMLCTKSSETENICDNDEGTPLACLSGLNEWYLAGMLTYQRYCGIYKQHPPVFSNIFAMRKFIDQVTGQKQYLVPYDHTMYVKLPPTTPGPTEVTTSKLEITETTEKVIENIEATTSTLSPILTTEEELNETETEITDHQYVDETPTPYNIEDTTIISSDVYGDNTSLVDVSTSPNNFTNIYTEENATTDHIAVIELSTDKGEEITINGTNITSTGYLQDEYESVSQNSPQELNETIESSNLKQPLETESVFSSSGSSDSTMFLETTSKMPNNETISEISLARENESSIQNYFPTTVAHPITFNRNQETLQSPTEYPHFSTVAPILADAQSGLEATTVTSTSKQDETTFSVVPYSSSHSSVTSEVLSLSDDSMLSDGGLPYSHQATNIESPTVSFTSAFTANSNISPDDITTQQTKNTGDENTAGDIPGTVPENIYPVNTFAPDFTIPATTETTQESVNSETAATRFDFQEYHGSRVIGDSPFLVFSNIPNGETGMMEKLQIEPETGMAGERELETQFVESRDMHPAENIFHSGNRFTTVKQQRLEAGRGQMETTTIPPFPIKETTAYDSSDSDFLFDQMTNSMTKPETNLQDDPKNENVDDSEKISNLQQNNESVEKEKEADTNLEVSSVNTDPFLSTATSKNQQTMVNKEFNLHPEIKSDFATLPYVVEKTNMESRDQNPHRETEGLFREESGPVMIKDVHNEKENIPTDAVLHSTTRMYDTTLDYRILNEGTCGNWTLKLESNETEPLAAGFEKWPSLGFLQMVTQPAICTSSILSSQWVLTSLSCLILRDSFLKPENWVFLGGLVDPNSSTPATQHHLVKQIIPHPGNWNESIFTTNDLALVMLKDKILFNTFSQRICLPELPVQPNQQCFAAGWNKNHSGETPLNFQALPVTVEPTEECNSSSHYNGMQLQSVLCIQHSQSMISPCQVDAGTSLLCISKEKQWEIQGVLPAPYNCDTKQTIVYNNVLSARLWILTNMETSETATETP